MEGNVRARTGIPNPSACICSCLKPEYLSIPVNVKTQVAVLNPEFLDSSGIILTYSGTAVNYSTSWGSSRSCFTSCPTGTQREILWAKVVRGPKFAKNFFRKRKRNLSMMRWCRADRPYKNTLTPFRPIGNCCITAHGEADVMTNSVVKKWISIDLIKFLQFLKNATSRAQLRDFCPEPQTCFELSLSSKLIEFCRSKERKRLAPITFATFRWGAAQNA